MVKDNPRPPRRRPTTPVESYAVFAEHYRERTKRIAQQAVQAMTAGDIERASILYEQGVFSQRNYDHYRRIAACIGPLPLDQLRLPRPEKK